MYAYSTASTSEAAYFIGGANTKTTVAEFKNDSWREFGKLTQGRYWHGSISNGDDFFVVGGSSSGARYFYLLTYFKLIEFKLNSKLFKVQSELRSGI